MCIIDYSLHCSHISLTYFQLHVLFSFFSSNYLQFYRLCFGKTEKSAPPVGSCFPHEPYEHNEETNRGLFEPPLAPSPPWKLPGKPGQSLLSLEGLLIEF